MAFIFKTWKGPPFRLKTVQVISYCSNEFTVMGKKCANSRFVQSVRLHNQIFETPICRQKQHFVNIFCSFY